MGSVRSEIGIVPVWMREIQIDLDIPFMRGISPVFAVANWRGVFAFPDMDSDKNSKEAFLYHRNLQGTEI